MHINESQMAISSASFPGTDNVDEESDDEVLGWPENRRRRCGGRLKSYARPVVLHARYEEELSVSSWSVVLQTFFH